MPSAADRLDYGPAPDAGSVRAFGLALLVHALLIAALTWGVNWKRTDRSVAFEAELWSSIPVAAAPKLIETPPPAPPTPEVKAAPEPAVDIALEQEKKRKLLLQQQDAEAQALAKKDKDLKAQQDQAKLKAAEELRKLDAKNRADQQVTQKQADAAAQKQRQDALNRMMGLAGASGSANATGSAPKSSGPSASYGGKVVAKVLPNVVFTDDVAGNPKADVEVTSASDGTIISRRLVKSSGNRSWDEAVLKAIDRTGTMPRDTDGKVPSPMTLGFQPQK